MASRRLREKSQGQSARACWEKMRTQDLKGRLASRRAGSRCREEGAMKPEQLQGDLKASLNYVQLTRESKGM